MTGDIKLKEMLLKHKIFQFFFFENHQLETMLEIESGIKKVIDWWVVQVV